MAGIKEYQEDFSKEMKTLDPIGDLPLAPAHGIAALALNMAMKYHDMQMIPDGLTYQQYKMEGRNMREIGLVDVFETAARIEVWLLGASDRIASIVIDCVKDAVTEGEDAVTEGEEDNKPLLPEG